MKKSWIQHQIKDKYFSWYASGGKEKLKCQIAWQWYQDNHPEDAKDALKFSKPVEILEFLDNTPFSLDEKRHHLEQIKKKFKAQQTAANRKGKRQTNLSLSNEARQMLEELAKTHRMELTETVELLIQNAHKRGTPN